MKLLFETILSFYFTYIKYPILPLYPILNIYTWEVHLFWSNYLIFFSYGLMDNNRTMNRWEVGYHMHGGGEWEPELKTHKKHT